MRKPRFWATTLLVSIATRATAEDYDLVILNGRVMDPETNHDAIANVGIRDGRIQVITDTSISGTAQIDATFKAGENGLPTTGIPHVVINGEIVVNTSEVQRIYPGQPIRFPVEPQGRFEPLDRQEWLDRHTLQPENSHDATGLGSAAADEQV